MWRGRLGVIPAVSTKAGAERQSQRAAVVSAARRSEGVRAIGPAERPPVMRDVPARSADEELANRRSIGVGVAVALLAELHDTSTASQSSARSNALPESGLHVGGSTKFA